MGTNILKIFSILSVYNFILDVLNKLKLFFVNLHTQGRAVLLFSDCQDEARSIWFLVNDKKTPKTFLEHYRSDQIQTKVEM